MALEAICDVRTGKTALRYTEQTHINAIYLSMPSDCDTGATDTPGYLAVSNASAEQSSLQQQYDRHVNRMGKTLR